MNNQAESIIPIRCADCQFCTLSGQAGPIVGSPKEMECRRNPPGSQLAPAQGGVAIMTFFPKVTPDLWCGEFQPKE